MRPITRLIALGAATAAAGVLGFAAVHALLISPIWIQALARAPMALVAGVPMAWAFLARFGEMDGAPFVPGARFGATLFATLLPATAFESTFRLLDIRLGDWVEPVVVLALAAASGAIAGGLSSRGRQTPIAFAAATMGLTTLMGGPVPVVNSAAAALLFLSFLPLCMAAGVTLAAAHRAAG